MALTISNLVTERVGRGKQSRCVVALDSSYPTGGESLTAAQLGLTDIQTLNAASSGGYTFEYDDTNAKLKAYYGDNNNASDGALIEVPNATDLSAVTNVQVLATGL